MGNTIALNQALKEQFLELMDDTRKSIVKLAKLAAAIKSEHILANGKKYDAEFNDFWNDYSMDDIFKSKNNFSKYALAGDAIRKVEKRFQDHAHKMPYTLNALYEISQLTEEELTLCLQNTYKKKDRNAPPSEWKAPKKPRPLIHPQVKGGEIKSWRDNWRDPKAPDTDYRKLPLAEIKIHKSLFHFIDGKHSGEMNKDLVVDIAAALTVALDKFGENLVRVDLHAGDLCDDFDARQKAALDEVEQKLVKKKKKSAS